jgi:hypothetical protein
MNPSVEVKSEIHPEEKGRGGEGQTEGEVEEA